MSALALTLKLNFLVPQYNPIALRLRSVWQSASSHFYFSFPLPIYFSIYSFLFHTFVPIIFHYSFDLVPSLGTEKMKAIACRGRQQASTRHATPCKRQWNILQITCIMERWSGNIYPQRKCATSISTPLSLSPSLYLSPPLPTHPYQLFILLLLALGVYKDINILIDLFFLRYEKWTLRTKWSVI